MKNRGDEQASISDALCRFLSVEELRRALRYYLDIDLDEVALANNKRDLVFRVVDYADRHGLMVGLAEAACSVNKNKDLREAFKSCLEAGDVEGKAEPQIQPLEAIPIWALSNDEKVRIVRGLQRRAVEKFLLPETLRSAFARSFDKNGTDTVIRMANKLRCEADPDFNPEAIILHDLGNWDFIGELSYWNRAFDRACEKGGRLLGSLLLVAPPDVYEANKRDILSLLDQVSEEPSG